MSPRALLAGSWTLVILALCWLPRSLLPVREHGPKPEFVPNLDKAVHLGIFAVFAVLWMRAGTSGSRAGKVLILGLALAVVSELGQNLPIVNRDAGLPDGLADALGLLVGLAAYAFAPRSGGTRPT